MKDNKVEVEWKYNTESYTPKEHDSITLNIKSRVDNRSYVEWKDVKTQTTGTKCTFDLKHKGYYDIRYFDYGIGWVFSPNKPPIATSMPFLYGPHVPLQVKDSPSDNQIWVRCMNKKDTSENDIIALYHAGEPSNRPFIDHKRVGRACKL